MDENHKQHDRSRFTFAFAAFALGMLIAATILNTAQNSAQERSAALISYKGNDFTLQELPTSVAIPYYEREYEHFEKQRAILEEAAIQLAAADLASEENIDEKQARVQLLRVETPSDQEVNHFFDINQERIGKPFYKIKEDIIRYLTQQKTQAKRASVLDALKQKGEFTLLIQAPESPEAAIDSAGYPTALRP